MRLVVTGAHGLIGWHAAARVHAENCAARFRGLPPPFDLVTLDHGAFEDDGRLHAALDGANAVLHFAGVNRGSDETVEAANPAIAERLVSACRGVGTAPHVVYANSTHSATDTPYGRSKRRASEIFGASGVAFTNLVLPHVFGECARPYYNNVTATLVDQIVQDVAPTVNPDGRVDLVHAGVAADAAIDAARHGRCGTIAPEPRTMSVPDLLARLRSFHEAYSAGIFPGLTDPFEIALFNTYRAALYPHGFPRALVRNSDRRGTLFEAVKGGGGGQTFLSWTHPGVTRGDHFHLGKVERFLVLEGQARIRIRRVLRDSLWVFDVTGDDPAVVDMPTLHTHSIENTGDGPLLTLFWAHEIFDPSAPDTYADAVLGGTP